jgi:hypothetical protein
MNKTFYIVFAIAALMASVNAACNPFFIKKWMSDCKSVRGTAQNKCNDSACRKALFFLVKSETLSCYIKYKLGPSSDLLKYYTLERNCKSKSPLAKL